jgi:hypothetical protein
VRRVLAAVIALMAAWTVAPAAGARAGTAPAASQGLERFGVRLVDVPIADASNPRGLRYIVDYLPPGRVIHRRILVLNQETRRAHFTVYPDQATIGHGQFTGDAGATRGELTSWITVRHPRLTLGPNGTRLDMVTIRVPKAATRGEHYGVIWVQQVAHARTKMGIGVTEVSRVGIRIYLAVGPGGAPPTTFTITSITAHRTARGWPFIVARVRNTGGRAVDLSGQVRLSQGPGGTIAGPFPEQQVITLAPGQSGNMTFALGRRLPAGPWHVKITLVSGFITHSAQATVQLDASTTPAGIHLPTLAWGAGAMLVLIILALFLVRRTRQARHARA